MLGQIYLVFTYTIPFLKNSKLINLIIFTVVGHSPETSVIQNVPKQKSIVDYSLGNTLN